MIDKNLISKFWDSNKNCEDIDLFTESSAKKVWWKCDRNHSWRTSFYYHKGKRYDNFCPYCSNRKLLVGFNDCKTVIPDLLDEWDYDNNDIDPSNIIVNSNKKFWWTCKKGHKYLLSVKRRSLGSGCQYCSGSKVLKGFNDIATTHPHILNKWNYEKNVISPEEVSKGKKSKVWWKCEKDHNYEMTIGKVISGRGCPYCSNNKVLKGYNDLQSNYPDISKQWDQLKNEKSPADFTPGSSFKAFWICEKDHSYSMSIHKRVSGLGCYYCSNKKVLKGYNDFLTTHKEISQEWNYDKNTISPDSITYGYDKKAWWICKNNHEWEASVLSRSNGLGCPYCSNRKVLEGFNDIKTTNPEIVKFWDYSKNSIFPSQITYGSNSKIWLICNMGHSFQSTAKRVTKGEWCPYCSNKKVLKGYNDMETTHPHLIKEWNFKDNIFLPSDITYGSGKMISWICKEGHIWNAPPSSRTAGYNCPHCFKYTSNKEKEILKYINSITKEKVISNSKDVLNPYEIDIYIPSLKLAFEFNGIYWHTEKQGRGKEYHYNKWKGCKDKGIRLITIWEDEWDYKKNSIKKLIESILNKNAQIIKTTRIDEINIEEYLNFSSKYDPRYFNGLNIMCKNDKYYAIYDQEYNIVSSFTLNFTPNRIDMKNYIAADQREYLFFETIEYIKRIAQSKNISEIHFTIENERNQYFLEKYNNIKIESIEPSFTYFKDKRRYYRENTCTDNHDIIWDCGKTKYIISDL